ncbi:MAG: glycoside hydrolase family 16 protein [Lachnospiraceae bacterium]|nr:glycoside hydrolase family 16 protein [Lachnospiraceae bacterium]
MESKKLSYEGYNLVWEDDFDGDSLNRDDWNVELHEPLWVNEEWQKYIDSDENIYVKDSILHLQPVRVGKKDEAGSYTSGRVNTIHKHDFIYGIFEARLKIPRGKGYLPAFWLLADEEVHPWPICGEIDIMEIHGSDTVKNYGTIHYGLPHEQNQGIFELENGDFAEEFHDFALEWLPGKLLFYVDGILYHEITDWYSGEEDGTMYPGKAPFDHEFHIILNLAVGNNWAGYPDGSTSFENAFEIDYVRVYQK